MNIREISHAHLYLVHVCVCVWHDVINKQCVYVCMCAVGVVWMRLVSKYDLLLVNIT